MNEDGWTSWTQLSQEESSFCHYSLGSCFSPQKHQLAVMFHSDYVILVIFRTQETMQDRGLSITSWIRLVHRRYVVGYPLP